jgi:UDP-galactopyranose mutase
VAGPYRDIVYLADRAEEFIAACELALAGETEDRACRRAGAERVLSQTSWDRTAESMNQLIEKSIACSSERRKKRASRAEISEQQNGRGEEPHVPSHASAKATEQDVIVVGAGPTGLSAAYHLGGRALLVEQNDRVGGWCRSIVRNGFTFDFAGHIMFSNDRYVHQMYEMLLGENVHWQDREAWIYSKGVYTRYPFQGSLYGLPADVIKECILGAIECQFGSSKTAAAAGEKNGSAHVNGHAGNGPATNGHAANGHAHQNGKGNGKSPDHGAFLAREACDASQRVIEDCCADGILESSAPLRAAKLGIEGVIANRSAEAENFEQFIYRVWGRGIAKHFAIPYNRKLWAVPLGEMETSWLGGRVPMPDLEEMLDGALQPSPKPMGPNARFGYPLRGGFQALMDGFLPHLQSKLRLNTRVARISPSRHEITFSDGERATYQHLISTMPLPVLVRLAGDEAPAEVQDAAAGLRYISVRCVHIGVGRENLTDKHWIYYPEDTVFHRIFVQGHASPHCNPPGGFGLTCEITYHDEYKPLPSDGDELIRLAIEDCQRVGFFDKQDPILAAFQVDLPHAYVVYDHARPKNVKLIREWLAQHDIILAGRYSEWEYYNSDHAFLAGKKAAEIVLVGRTAESLVSAVS